MAYRKTINCPKCRAKGGFSRRGKWYECSYCHGRRHLVVPFKITDEHGSVKGGLIEFPPEISSKKMARANIVKFSAKWKKGNIVIEYVPSESGHIVAGLKHGLVIDEPPEIEALRALFVTNGIARQGERLGSNC